MVHATYPHFQCRSSVKWAAILHCHPDHWMSFQWIIARYWAGRISGVSPKGGRYGGFRKWWYPQIIHLNRDFHYKSSILGYPYFWKHPHWGEGIAATVDGQNSAKIRPRSINARKDWDKLRKKLPINWCRMSSVNRMFRKALK